MVNDHYAYEPRLAQNWTASPDARTFTFNLRPGLKWSDGEPFTSKDVLFTFKLLANPASGSAHAAKFDHVVGIADYRNGKTPDVAGFRAPDDNTFVVELDQPNAAFISSISWPFYGILPEHILGSADVKTLSDNPFFLNPTVGMGPFTFVQLRDRPVRRAEEEPQLSRAGGASTASSSSRSRPTWPPRSSKRARCSWSRSRRPTSSGSRPLPRLKIDSKPGPGIILMAVAVDQPYLQDKRVRQAMLYAIDRAGIVSQVLAGQASITNTHVMGPPEAIPSDLNKYEYNPDKARQLLQDAGWDPERVIKIQWIQGIRDRDATVQIVQSQLQAVGMKVELNPLEAGPLRRQHEEPHVRPQPVRRRAVHHRWRQHRGARTSARRRIPAGGNNAHYCNADVDAAFATGRATSDPAQRNQAYQQVARITNDEVPYIWLYVPSAVWAYSDKLQNFKAHGELTYGFWNAADWKLAQ